MKIWNQATHQAQRIGAHQGPITGVLELDQGSLISFGHDGHIGYWFG